MKITTGKIDRLPFATKQSLSVCFDWIPTGDLYGLDHVEVMNSVSDLPLEPDWRKKKCERDDVWINAMYFRKHERAPASIALFLNAMFFPLDALLRFPPITTLYFAQIVAHEVGHHLFATRGFIFTPEESYKSDAYEEEMANRYAFKVVERMKSKWYYRVADRALKFYSKVHFEDGRQNWKRNNFAAAATSWYKAWLLDLDNETAGELYWTAKNREDDIES